MFRSHCPTADKLEAFSRVPKPGRLADHIESCPTCRKIVDDFRDESALLTELRQAASAEPSPPVRRRLRNISREAVFESGNGRGPEIGA